MEDIEINVDDSVDLIVSFKCFFHVYTCHFVYETVTRLSISLIEGLPFLRPCQANICRYSSEDMGSENSECTLHLSFFCVLVRMLDFGWN